MKPILCSTLLVLIVLTSRPATALIIGPDESGTVFPGEALILVGEVDSAAADFTHRFTFGFEVPGTAQASVWVDHNDNVLIAGMETGTSSVLEGPTIAGFLSVEVGVPLLFPIIDTSSLPDPSPYTLTVTGRLLDAAFPGSYSFRVALVPEPASMSLFGVALVVGLLFRRRSR
jgi:hypothetical protein